jgi:hypothetical protein
MQDAAATQAAVDAASAAVEGLLAAEAVVAVAVVVGANVSSNESLLV